MLRIYIQAPFAACRTFTAGWFRPTAAFLTPSAAYGLLLNLAGIESRLIEGDKDHDGRVAASLTKTGLPRCRLAIGIPDQADPPLISSLFQQLHNYPVGRDAGLPPEFSMGNKNNITPVRREVLVALKALVLVECEGNLERRICDGLEGKLNDGRYGLPFLGDNSFLPDKIQLVKHPRPARWYERVDGSAGGPKSGTSRLTIRIDRADLSQTVSHLFAPSEYSTPDAPASAWVDVGPP